MSHFPTMQEVRVRSLTWAADGVLQVDLVHPAGAVLPAFEAAAHLDLLLPNGISRSYSLCNAPAEQPQRYQLGVG